MDTAVWEPVDIRLIANSLSIARYLLSVRAASLSPSMSRVRRRGRGRGGSPACHLVFPGQTSLSVLLSAFASVGLKLLCTL